jgi:hypothetical protein
MKNGRKNTTVRTKIGCSGRKGNTSLRSVSGFGACHEQKHTPITIQTDMRRTTNVEDNIKTKKKKEGRKTQNGRRYEPTTMKWGEEGCEERKELEFNKIKIQKKEKNNNANKNNNGERKEKKRKEKKQG